MRAPRLAYSIDCWTLRRRRLLYILRSSLEPQYSLWASGLTSVRGSYGGCSSSIASMMDSMCVLTSSRRFGLAT